MNPNKKALRLADELMQAHKGHADEGPTSFSEAATELRRLYRENLEWQKKAVTWFASPEAAQQLAGCRELGQRLNAAEAQRDELLAALKKIKATKFSNWSDGEVRTIASAAIAKVKGRKKRGAT